jgi:hypothetical protein
MYKSIRNKLDEAEKDARRIGSGNKELNFQTSEGLLLMRELDALLREPDMVKEEWHAKIQKLHHKSRDLKRYVSLKE